MILLLTVITDAEREQLGHMLVCIANGEEKALAAVYKAVGGRLLSVAMGLTRDVQASQDVLHDSFIKIVQCANQFKRGTNAYAWLCTIVRNTALNKIKSENLRRGTDIDSFFNMTDSRDMAENSDTKVLIEGAMKTISSKERTVIWLKYFNDMTVREIAQELSIPKSTLQELIKTAEEKLKKALCAPDKNP